MQNIYAQPVTFEFGTLLSFGLTVALFITSIWVAWQAWLWMRANAMHGEVVDWLRDYRRRLTGGNRFVINELLLRSHFPEYGHAVVSKVWRRIKDEQLIVIDDKDGEWCIK